MNGRSFNVFMISTIWKSATFADSFPTEIGI
jgi:hypothetical protein